MPMPAPPARPRAAARGDERASELRKALAIASWLSLACLILLFATRAELRSTILTFLPLGYLLVIWFFLARTKTLSWQSIAGLFSACLPWSVGVGIISQAIAQAAGLPVDSLGARTAIAALTEQSLNLLPLLALALLFPSRVKRFSVADWLLVGFASGLAFQTTQEFSRLDGPHAHYSLSPISGGLATDGAGFAGQHLLTALTSVTIGLAVAAWRHAGNPKLNPLGRNVWRTLAVLAPIGCWWLTISVHAGFNASQVVGSRWLTSADPSVPWPLRLGWRLGDHGFGLGWLLLVLLLVALLIDAGRLRNAAEEADDPLPSPFAPTQAADQWAGRLTRWAGTSSATPISAAVWLIASCCAVVAYAVRDLVVVLVAHSIDHPARTETAATTASQEPARSSEPARPSRRRESRWAAIARGRAAGVMVRSIRKEAIARVCRTDDRAGRRVSQLFAGVGLAAVLVAALWLAPYWARGIGRSVTVGGGPSVLRIGDVPVPWLAGIDARLQPWWDSLAFWELGAISLGFVALMMLSAGPLDLPLAVQGGSVMLVRRSARLTGTTGRELASDVRSYLAVSTPTEVLLDAVGAGLGLIPGRLIGNRPGASTGPEVRRAVKEFIADPVRFIAARRAAVRQARQPVVAPAAPPARVRPFADLPPIKLADGRQLAPLSDDDQRLFISTLDELIRGDTRTHDEASDYQVRIYGDDKRMVSHRPETWSDGANIEYGMLGSTAFYNGRGSSWYAPETLPEWIRHKAYLELDRRLIEFSTVVYYPASPFRALEITTNHPLVAHALEERMARLAIPGYVVLEP
jgi:hypothetical protein